MKSTVLIGVVLGLGLGTAGCGSTAESLCDRACECTGCNEDQRKACTDLAEDSELNAEQADCLSEYDELLSCFDSSFECVNNVPTYEGCAGEAINLLECGGQTDG
jgi:hypothetical protein